MAQEYRLEAVTRAGLPLGQLTDATLDHARWELNQPGEIVYDLKQSSPQIAIPQENINEVQLWVDSVDPNKPLQWGFHYKTREGPRGCNFTCPGLLQYMNHRFVLNATLTYTTIDQLQIGASIVQAMQDTADKDFNIGIGSYVASGVNRSREYKREEHQNALDILTEFPNLTDAAGVQTGFDYDIVLSGTTRLWTPYYPRKGTIRTQPILEWGKNVTDFDVDRDGGEMANRVYATGGSNGDVKFENNYTDAASVATYKEWQGVKGFGSEKDVAVLLLRAQNEVADRKVPVISPRVTAVEIPDLLLGVLQTGDFIPVQIDCGRTQVAATYRIRAIEWKPGPGNLTLELAIR